jgi:tetratricopeptide (TPR) repeat protein
MLALVLVASGHEALAAWPPKGFRRGGSTDQLPMYGGADRRADPVTAAEDDRFIATAAREFGNRRKAGEMFFEEGQRARLRGDNRMAMKRFNQAWLLDPNGAGPYYGFAAVLSDQGRECDAARMAERALDNSLSKPIPLADAGAWYAACAAGDQTLGREERGRYQARSRELLQRAVNLAPGNDYVYGRWGAALYWQGDYRGAWEKVRRQRELGGTPDARTINMLQAKMREP